MNSKSISSIYIKNSSIKLLSISTLLAIYIFNDYLDIKNIFFFLYTFTLYLLISIIMCDDCEEVSLHLLLMDSILTYFIIINYIILAVSILNNSVSDIIRASLLVYGLVIMNQAIIIKFSKYTLSSNEIALGFLITNVVRYAFYQNFELLFNSFIILTFTVLGHTILFILFKMKHADIKYVIPYNMLPILTTFFMDKSSIIFWCIFILTALTLCIIENFDGGFRYSDTKLVTIFLVNTLVAILYNVFGVDHTYLFNIMLLLIYANILLNILSKLFGI